MGRRETRRDALASISSLVGTARQRGRCIGGHSWRRGAAVSRGWREGSNSCLRVGVGTAASVYVCTESHHVV